MNMVPQPTVADSFTLKRGTKSPRAVPMPQVADLKSGAPSWRRTIITLPVGGPVVGFQARDRHRCAPSQPVPVTRTQGDGSRGNKVTQRMEATCRMWVLKFGM